MSSRIRGRWPPTSSASRQRRGTSPMACGCSAAKWGITVGEQARKRLGYVCLGLAVALVAIGLVTIRGLYHRSDGASSKRIQTETTQLR